MKHTPQSEKTPEELLVIQLEKLTKENAEKRKRLTIGESLLGNPAGLLQFKYNEVNNTLLIQAQSRFNVFRNRNNKLLEKVLKKHGISCEREDEWFAFGNDETVGCRIKLDALKPLEQIKYKWSQRKKTVDTKNAEIKELGNLSGLIPVIEGYHDSLARKELKRTVRTAFFMPPALCLVGYGCGIAAGGPGRRR